MLSLRVWHVGKTLQSNILDTIQNSDKFHDFNVNFQNRLMGSLTGKFWTGHAYMSGGYL